MRECRAFNASPGNAGQEKSKRIYNLPTGKPKVFNPVPALGAASLQESVSSVFG